MTDILAGPSTCDVGRLFLCMSSGSNAGFVPDWDRFLGGNAFLLGGKAGLSRNGVAFGEEEPFWGSLSPNGVGFGEEMHFLGEVVPARGTELLEQPLG